LQIYLQSVCWGTIKNKVLADIKQTVN